MEEDDLQYLEFLLCGVLSLPVLFQQIGVKLSDMQNLHTADVGMEAVAV